MVINNDSVEISFPFVLIEDEYYMMIVAFL